MTTDEALEYCKRFDDPKLQSAMATDFSRATGSVGALLALRAELASLSAELDKQRSVSADAETRLTTLRGKLRELDARLSAASEDAGYTNGDYRVGLKAAYEHAKRLLRELGL